MIQKTESPFPFSFNIFLIESIFQWRLVMLSIRVLCSSSDWAFDTRNQGTASPKIENEHLNILPNKYILPD